MQRFAQLAPHEKIEVRIAWLERKVVGLLWGMIGLASMAVGFGAAYFVGELMETRSMRVLAPVGIIAWLVSGWVFQKREFRGAPPCSYVPSTAAIPFKWQRSSAASAEIKGGLQRGTKLCT